MTFNDLKDFSDRVGAPYGSEDLSLFLYSLIKMQKPNCIVELGTGDGASTVWMAQALKENGTGQLITVDNGSPRISCLGPKPPCGWGSKIDLHQCSAFAIALP